MSNGGRADKTKLVYSVVFFHCLLHVRHLYGPRAGLNDPSLSPPFQDLFTAVAAIDDLVSNSEAFSVSAMREIIGECVYELKSSDKEVRRLLNAVVKSCLNDKVFSTNRYRFSASQEFFVPNKTLYKDYLEFIKNLPGSLGYFNYVSILIPSFQSNEPRIMRLPALYGRFDQNISI